MPNQNYAWAITVDDNNTNCVGLQFPAGSQYDAAWIEGHPRSHRFHLLDENNEILYTGVYVDLAETGMDATEPLEDFGESHGCVSIEIYDPSEDDWIRIRNTTDPQERYAIELPDISDQLNRIRKDMIDGAAGNVGQAYKHILLQNPKEAVRLGNAAIEQCVDIYRACGAVTDKKEQQILINIEDAARKLIIQALEEIKKGL